MDFYPINPPAEFEDRYGKIRPVATCSIIGRFEFFERLQQLEERLRHASDGEGWQEFYERDSRLQHIIKRCLELNGIDPEWVTLDMVEGLLLYRTTEAGENQIGWLVELNQPKKPATPGEKGLNLEEIIAALSTHVDSLEEALRLAREEPAALVLDTLEAKANLTKKADPKVQKQTVDQERLAATKARLEKMATGELKVKDVTKSIKV